MPIFRKILAIDTSRGDASVALLEGSEIIARGAAGPPAEALLGLIDALREPSSFEPELVAVGLGPGSFTGTRVGLATAKALAIARGLPIVGVCSLIGLARSRGDAEVALTSDAGRKQVYAARYRLPDDAPAIELDAPRLEPLDAPHLGEHFAFGRTPVEDLAVWIGLEARLRVERDGPDDSAQVEPLYVRSSDAKLPDTPLAIHSSTSSKDA